MGASCSLVKKPVVSIEDNDTQPILGNNSCINLTTLNSGEVKPANVIDEIQPVEVLDDNNDPNHPVIFGVRTILEWKAAIKIFRYHWWPMQEKQTYSVYNNLYADNGGLDKYDALMGTKSKDFQKEHHFRAIDSTANDANWSGFCDKATSLSCLYEYPKNMVLVKYKDQKMEFSVFDIEALMIIACDNAINNHRGIFLGQRNNSSHPVKNNKSEPLPSELLEMLNIVCKSNTAFAMDIDSGPAVWNYSYDSVLVQKQPRCYLPHEKPRCGYTQYLKFVIQSTAYPDKNQTLWGYINTENDVSMSSVEFSTCKKNEVWITDYHPDFIWKHYPKNTPWSGKCRINPKVDANIVYKIYKHSLIENTPNSILNLDEHSIITDTLNTILNLDA
jgi:hypothetical protein